MPSSISSTSSSSSEDSLILPTPIMDQNLAIGPVTVGEDEKAAAAASVAADSDSARMPPPPFTRRLTRPKAAPEALKGLGVDVFSPTLSTAFITPGEPPAGGLPTGLDSAFSEKPPGMSRTRSGTRAPAPPPIFLRRSEGISSRTAADDRLPSPEGPGSAGASEELASEATDNVPEMAATPRRATFQAGLNISDGAPSTPAWQNFDSPRMPASGRASLGVPPFSASRGSPSLSYASPGYPYSPVVTRSSASAGILQSPTPSNDGRFEPTPQHGIHARNLSIFFPQPGNGSADANNKENGEEAPETVISGSGAGAGGEKKRFPGEGEWTFGKSSRQSVSTPEPKGKRRGHHHRHSLSHNFFSFLDPTVTDPSLAAASPRRTTTDAGLASPLPPVSPRPSDAPTAVPMPLTSSSLALGSPTSARFSGAVADPRTQLLASFAALQFLIGAGIWVEGQMGGWRSLAGVGYLGVFDALGAGVMAVAATGEGKQLRRPYGNARFVNLLHFAQTLFLVFAAVYIAKESLETVILGAHEHGSGGHGHGHGHGDVGDGEGRPFPVVLLMCMAAGSAMSAFLFENHVKLVDAVGTLFLPYQYLQSSVVMRYPYALANPFALSIGGSAIGLLLGSQLVAPQSLQTFDNLAALLLTLLTIALSLPPTKTFGLVLLQTAPAPASSQMRSVKRALKDLNGDRRVLIVGTPRCWAITAGTAPPAETPLPTPQPSRRNSLSTPTGTTTGASPSNSPTLSPRLSFSQSLKAAGLSPSLAEFGFFGRNPSYPSLLSTKEKDQPIVVSLQVGVGADASESDVLDVTRRAWSALNRYAGGGEVCVGVRKGWSGE